MKRALITGTSGWIAQSLIPRLKDLQYEIVSYDRKNPPSSLESFDLVVHLAGKNVAEERWNEKTKAQILSSRVELTKKLSSQLAALKNKPSCFISASATGFYGDRGEEILTEDSKPGNNFLAGVCRSWEDAVLPATQAGIRTANIRIGMVLNPSGGALKKMLPAFRFGLGGVLGPGTQYVSWICLSDLISGILEIIRNDSLRGPVNLVSPQAVTNREFTETLAKSLRRPVGPTAPAWALRLLTGQMADELLLASARVIPQKLVSANFHFQFPELSPALQNLLHFKV